MIKSGLNPGTVVLWAGGACPLSLGAECKILSENNDGYNFQSGIHNCWEPYASFNLKEKTMDNLQVGDVLENQDVNYTREVLQVTGMIIVVNDSDDNAYGVHAIKALQEGGWSVKAKEPEVKEVTLKEVAAAMNVDVSKLRIKDEAIDVSNVPF